MAGTLNPTNVHGVSALRAFSFNLIGPPGLASPGKGWGVTGVPRDAAPWFRRQCNTSVSTRVLFG
jgi:hypothetical protein